VHIPARAEYLLLPCGKPTGNMKPLTKSAGFFSECGLAHSVSFWNDRDVTFERLSAAFPRQVRDDPVRDINHCAPAGLPFLHGRGELLRSSGCETVESGFCRANQKVGRICTVPALRSGLTPRNVTCILFPAIWRPNPQPFAPPIEEQLLNRVVQLTESDPNCRGIWNRDLRPVPQYACFSPLNAVTANLFISAVPYALRVY
jgi:hypothetical protein